MPTTEAARFNSDIRRMLTARNKIGSIIAAIAENPDKFATPSGNYEIRNVTEICETFQISPRFFRDIFKSRWRKSGNRAYVEFSEGEILAASDALKSVKKSMTEYRTDSEAAIFALVVAALIGSASSKQTFYGLE
jgi:hypothetical protein